MLFSTEFIHRGNTKKKTGKFKGEAGRNLL